MSVILSLSCAPMCVVCDSVRSASPGTFSSVGRRCSRVKCQADLSIFIKAQNVAGGTEQMVEQLLLRHGQLTGTI